jgi:DNA invertase Pin-like site-specific DNA recombinase
MTTATFTVTGLSFASWEKAEGRRQKAKIRNKKEDGRWKGSRFIIRGVLGRVKVRNCRNGYGITNDLCWRAIEKATGN